MHRIARSDLLSLKMAPNKAVPAKVMDVYPSKTKSWLTSLVQAPPQAALIVDCSNIEAGFIAEHSVMPICW
ncbi:hypothetical protein CEXT_460711 [Caerostris extrusa]|uniref:Uncharacterized protein n=1 Tax=Caerostris extrusa TaxID=172846 RepID=A0AAV4SXD4_CAEEX|nr:hypothetical protein CEXT_460711 [Caerostris extrusa]